LLIETVMLIWAISNGLKGAHVSLQPLQCSVSLRRRAKLIG